ncbi:MAG TPA: hypothetical protein VHK26_12290 [Methyloceanibacter sp.]|jgi:hypothetical protein|nr:hypothetical protein [Methyloceanibacter sp.]
MGKLIRSVAILAALAALGFAPTGVLADKVKESGSMDATYSKREVQPIPDQDGHILMLTDAAAVNKDTAGTGFLDGFTVNVREMVDLARGTGPSQGYVIFSKGSDQLVLKISGMTTTTIKDGQPNTTFKGSFAAVSGKGALAGAEGEGTYSGYFTAEDKYHVDWEGTRTVQKDAMASPEN